MSHLNSQVRQPVSGHRSEHVNVLLTHRTPGYRFSRSKNTNTITTILTVVVVV
jgi:hypothetical protein